MPVLGKCSREMSAIHVIRTYCLPTMLYGYEMWTLSDSSIRPLQHCSARCHVVCTDCACSANIAQSRRDQHHSADCFQVGCCPELVYAASAWYVFCAAADRDRLEAVIRRGIRSGLCSIDQLSVRELIDDAYDSLFSQLTNNENHVLHQLLPARRNTGCDVRPRDHDRLLALKPNSIVVSDFISRMLFRDVYWYLHSFLFQKHSAIYAVVVFMCPSVCLSVYRSSVRHKPVLCQNG